MATTKKKNPFEDKPFTSGGTPAPEKNVSGQTKGVTIPGFNPVMPGQTPTPQKSMADVPAATTKNATADTTPRIIRDASGKSVGVQLPGEKEITGLKTKEISELIAGYYNSFSRQEALKAKTAGTPAKDLQAQELISQIGQLSPEQQALANSNPELITRPNFGQVLGTAGERAAITGAGVAASLGGAAALGAPATGGLTLAGAGVIAGSAGVIAGASAFFTEYKKVDKANYDTASQNYDIARTNIDEAIDLINKGAGIKADMEAINKYNQALAQIELSERQLKELARDKNKYVKDIKDKLVEIQDFKTNDRRSKDYYMEVGIKKPSAGYI